MFMSRSNNPTPDAETEAHRLAAALTLPEPPAELSEIEAKLEGLAREAAEAEEFAQEINRHLGLYNYRMPDGSILAQVTASEIGNAFQRAWALRDLYAAAQSRVTALRREYGDTASAAIEPGVADITSAMLDKLDEMDALLGMLARVRADGASRRIIFRNRAVSDVATLVGRVRELRRKVGGA